MGSRPLPNGRAGARLEIKLDRKTLSSFFRPNEAHRARPTTFDVDACPAA